MMLDAGYGAVRRTGIDRIDQRQAAKSVQHGISGGKPQQISVAVTSELCGLPCCCPKRPQAESQR